MTDGPEDEGGTPPPDVDEEERQDRSGGGDGPSAGSVAEREAVAEDEDLFDGDDEG